MRIFAAETWTHDELKEQIHGADRRSLVVSAADSKSEVIAAFGTVLEFPADAEADLDGLNDALHDLGDAAEDAPVTIIWEVSAEFRTRRAFGLVCETLQDAESYAGQDLAIIAVCL
ncbi:barstar family protein [Pseudarthrobacter sp. PS3-L1]|uniref:barstar family protein n=1 Tax=Pseudarthrobacter sp. PS3-L1 TaxID=3046207 RepID=UPI0024B97041|nr:barstar family protein [Pseudarthrobacter sp. PS3-L1]MDJ0322086.1 barstar family protein [Pseudarthrobacter sp. PS3-L1]